MALSGYSVAKVVGLNSRAWTQSLKCETTRSALSAVGPSMMSQPVRVASAPRLAAQEQPPRRIGQEFCCVLDQKLRIDAGDFFALTGHRQFLKLPANDHGAQALRHDQRQRHVDGQKSHD
jgi:hypothetical protein